MLLQAGTLNGFALDSLNGSLGKVTDFYFDDSTWQIRYLLADVGRCLRHRSVLICPNSLGIFVPEAGNITVNLSRKEVRNSPSWNSDFPVSRQLEKSGVFLKSDEAHHSWDSHLRSVRQVTGYQIHSIDGSVGHAADMFIDDDSWVIRYLVVNTGDNGESRQVLVSPGWIDSVSWTRSTVQLNLPTAVVLNAQPLTDVASVNRQFKAECDTQPHMFNNTPARFDADTATDSALPSKE
jgi:hypothetical protein